MPLGLAAWAALLCTGCPAGASLDTPYQDYELPSSGATNTSTTATGTTGGMATCGDAEVDVIFAQCGSSACHGDPTGFSSDTEVESKLWFYLPTRKADWLNRPGLARGTNGYCSSEYIIDVANPSNSLLVTTLKGTSACGLKMPPFGDSSIRQR